MQTPAEEEAKLIALESLKGCAIIRPHNRTEIAMIKKFSERLNHFEIPTVDARLVKYAYWEPSEHGEYHCTNCGSECDIDQWHKALLNEYCGHCGCNMNGGSK